MKKIKTVIMVISLICIAALSAVIVFEKSETNKKDEEIRLMKIVSVERNGKVLQNGAINVRETAGTVMDYYKRMDGSSGSGSYNNCIENMENAYSAMKRTQTEMEEEIRILFPYGFNGDNEYEKNLEVYIRKVKVYSNLAERQYETVKGFSSGVYSYDYAIDTYYNLRDEMLGMSLSELRNGHEIIKNFAK